ncbi:MAG: lipopolysaccharide biosynthesis protein [Saprospiraceae bacterium]
MSLQSEFTKNVLKLMTGTSFAQLIPILISPILTRLYSPDDFGIFYLFASTASILQAVATGRFELAILIPEKQKDAAQILVLAAWVCGITSCLVLAIVFFFNAQVCTLLGDTSISPWLYLLPLSILTVCWFTILNFWYVRHKNFTIVTISKFMLSGVNAAGRVAFGLLNWGIAGLILGTLIAQFTALCYYLFRLPKQSVSLFKEVQTVDIKSKAKQYAAFSRNMVSGSFFNVSSTHLPNILINTFFVAAVAGFFGMIQRVIRLPLVTVASAFDEVFKQKASEEIHQHGHCRNIFYKTIKQLTGIAVIPFLIFYGIAPDLFRIVFGAEWQIAGEYAQIFCFPFFLHFIISGVVSIFYITEHTQWYSFSHFLQLVLVILALLVGKFYFNDATMLMYCLSFAYSITYGMMFFLLIYIMRKENDA